MIVLLFVFFQLMGWVILPIPLLRVLNLSHLPRRTPTARNTGGKRARASQNLTAYLQAMKVQLKYNAVLWKWPNPYWQNIQLKVCFLKSDILLHCRPMNSGARPNMYTAITPIQASWHSSLSLLELILRSFGVLIRLKTLSLLMKLCMVWEPQAMVFCLFQVLGWNVIGTELKRMYVHPNPCPDFIQAPF